MITINGWDRTFECAASRKRDHLEWYQCPAGTESTGLVMLRAKEGGLEALGVFQLLCQLHASMGDRELRRAGTLSRTSGRPLTLEEIAEKLRIPPEKIKKSIDLLATPEIAWISKDLPPSANHLPVDATDLPPSATDLPPDDHHIQTYRQTDKQTHKQEVGVCVSICEEIAKAYGSPPNRISNEAKRALFEAHKTQSFTADDLALVVRFIAKHKAGKFGKDAPKIAQSASRAVEVFPELLQRAEAARETITPYVAPKPMQAPERDEELTAEQKAEISAGFAELKNKMRIGGKQSG